MADAPKNPLQPNTAVDETSDDPQGQAAANGLKSIWDTQTVQDAVSGKNQQAFYNMALAAANGDPSAQQAMAQHSAQMAMGSIEVPRGPVAPTAEIIDQTLLPVTAGTN